MISELAKAVTKLDSILKKLSLCTPMTHTAKMIDHLMEQHEDDEAGTRRVAPAMNKTRDIPVHGSSVCRTSGAG
jgi:hypothetical protein